MASFYDKKLSDIPELKVPERSRFSTHVFHQYTIQLSAESRDGLKAWLQEKQIPSMIYYPVPLHLQRAYRNLGYKLGDLPVSEQLSGIVLSLPMHTELEDGQLDFISEQIHAFYKK